MELIRSDQIDQIAPALLKVQAAVMPVTKNAENPFFNSNYADLGAIWKEVGPRLHAEGILMLQPTGIAPDGIIIETILIHAASGQFVGSKLLVRPVKGDPQAYGSAISYGRRYALCALLSIITEDDDDGNAASHTDKPKREKKDKKEGMTTGEVVDTLKTLGLVDEPKPADPVKGEEVSQAYMELKARAEVSTNQFELRNWWKKHSAEIDALKQSEKDKLTMFCSDLAAHFKKGGSPL